MDSKITDDEILANITVDHSKPGFVIIKQEDWDTILFILADPGAEINHYTECGMLDYFKYRIEE